MDLDPLIINHYADRVSLKYKDLNYNLFFLVFLGFSVRFQQTDLGVFAVKMSRGEMAKNSNKTKRSFLPRIPPI